MRTPSEPSGLRLSRICWIVGWPPASSVSSQWAPSNTGVATNVDGGVLGRVFDSVPRIGGVPTCSPVVGSVQPQRAQ